ncbi:MAG: DUF6922 domain-containing protein [Candidatus Cryptobacteroides sp.]
MVHNANRLTGNMVVFDRYIPGGHIINPGLLWEYDLDKFDWVKGRTIVVQRVIEMGTPEDFFAAFDLYGGFHGFREIIKYVPYLNSVDVHFVCTFFNLKKEELRCCTRKRLHTEHWNS